MREAETFEPWIHAVALDPRESLCPEEALAAVRSGLVCVEEQEAA